MTNLLLKIFVKDRKNVQNDSVRTSYGNLASLTCIVLNILLSVGKIAAGVIFGVLSIVADGINNFCDCGNNIVTLISFKLSNKPADKEHPFGHQRIEYIAAMIVGFVIIILAIELIIQSVSTIIENLPLEFHFLTTIVLAVSVVVKLWMFLFNKKLSKAINSDILKANAMDSLLDAASTFFVLVALLVSHLLGVNIDGYVGIVISIVIALGGIKILRDTVHKLLGLAPDKKFLAEILARILSFDGVFGTHDLIVHSYGQNKYYASVHVELDCHLSSIEAHQIVDAIEQDFRQNTNIQMLVHVDPVDIYSQKAAQLQQKVTEIVQNLHPSFSVHGFQALPNQNSVAFDVAIPFDSQSEPEEVQKQLQNQLSTLTKDIVFEIHVEKQ